MTSPREQAIEEAALEMDPEAFLFGPKHDRRLSAIAKARRGIDQYEQARARLDGAKMMPDTPLTHQHVKRGTRYRIIGAAKLQSAFPLSDDSPLVIYQGEDGKLWARPPHEFNDGRFRAMHDATPKEKD